MVITGATSQAAYLILATWVGLRAILVCPCIMRLAALKVVASALDVLSVLREVGEGLGSLAVGYALPQNTHTQGESSTFAFAQSWQHCRQTHMHAHGVSGARLCCVRYRPEVSLCRRFFLLGVSAHPKGSALAAGVAGGCVVGSATITGVSRRPVVLHGSRAASAKALPWPSTKACSSAGFGVVAIGGGLGARLSPK